MSGSEAVKTKPCGSGNLTLAPQSLIELSFPFLQISKLAKIESYRKNIYRPAYYLHKWWARRSGAVFRAISLACLLEPTEDLMERFYLPNPTLARGKVVLDPFMGGGTTVGEMLRLGAKVIGIDINPVAWFLVKKIVEPISLAKLDSVFTEIEAKVAQKILDLYSTTCPKCNAPAIASYLYWVKVARCRLCGAEVPLRKSMVIAPHMSHPNTGLVTCPRCGELFVSDCLSEEIQCKGCAAKFNSSSGYTDGAKFTCRSCGSTDEIIRVYRSGESPPEHRLIGMAYVCQTCGKAYKKPRDGDYYKLMSVEQQFNRLKDSLIFPRGSIPSGYNTNQMRNYNYHYWHQMFNERQLLALSWLLEAVLQLDQENVREFMLLLFSGLLEFNNLFCSPKGLGTGAVRHIFAHHAYIPPKEVIEANVWGVGGSSGGFSTLYKERLRLAKEWALNPVEHKLTAKGVAKVPIPGERVASSLAHSFAELEADASERVWLLNRSSTSLPQLPSQRVDLIITDPPYFDNVMYSELADFFYRWLQIALQGRYPGFRAESVDKSEEAIRSLSGVPEPAAYQDVLERVFVECARVLKDTGLLVFTFHHSNVEAWQQLGNALRRAGFQVKRLYSVHAEMDVGVPILDKESVKFDAILVCKKGKLGNPDLTLEEELFGEIRRITLPLIGELQKEFSLSAKDTTSLASATWLLLYTQGRTEITANSLEHISL